MRFFPGVEETVGEVKYTVYANLGFQRDILSAL